MSTFRVRRGRDGERGAFDADGTKALNKPADSGRGNDSGDFDFSSSLFFFGVFFDSDAVGLLTRMSRESAAALVGVFGGVSSPSLEAFPFVSSTFVRSSVSRRPFLVGGRRGGPTPARS